MFNRKIEKMITNIKTQKMLAESVHLLINFPSGIGFKSYTEGQLSLQMFGVISLTKSMQEAYKLPRNA
jgi:hypothetical protein